MPETTRYSTMDLDDCEAYYHDEIAPEMRAEGLDPSTETPTYSWLNSNYSGFVKHLKRNFDLSPGDFYDDRGLPPENTTDESAFAFVQHDATRNALESYLTELDERRGRAEATIATRRSILRLYCKTYAEVNDSTDLLSPLLDASEQSDEMDRVAATFDVLRRLDGTLSTLASKRKYVQGTRHFYKHQLLFGPAEYNPLDSLEMRFGWDESPDWNNQALAREDVQALYHAAETPEDRFLVVGVCGWGLRPSEVCALHTRQLRLNPKDDDEPYIEFGEGERKNGPGTVALLAGLDTLRARVDALGENDDWTGYLLPSKSSESGHWSTETARRRFGNLADRASVTVADETPTPKMGRRFWYTIYGDAVRRVADRFADVAEEQGSASASVVLDNYLSDAEKRKHRREEMREELDGLFSESEEWDYQRRNRTGKK